MSSIAKLGAVLLLMMSVGGAVMAEEPYLAAPPSAQDTPRGACTAAMGGAPADDSYRRVRSTRDQSDDQPGAYQIHILYVEPADVTAALRLDEDGSLRRSVTAWLAWMARQTGGPKLRFDTCDGVLDVTYVKLRPQLDEHRLAYGSGDPDRLRDRLEAELKQTFSDPKKLYLVYYEGLALGECANAAHPPELPGRFTVVYLGNRFSASVLTAAANAGATTVEVYDPRKTDLPRGRFRAKLGSETVRVTAVVGTRVRLAAGLRRAHPIGTLLQAKGHPRDCRDNPFSEDGEKLGYMDFTSAHESLHLLGIVSRGAPHHAGPPVAPGHLNSTAKGGVYDLMYQGLEGDPSWGCGDTTASATCVLDPGRSEYFGLPGGSGLEDLAKSVFLEPTPPGAVLPPKW